MRIASLIALALLMTATANPGMLPEQGPERRYSWPPPKYQVRLDEDVRVAMRDGVRLAADLYFPLGLDGKLPVILIRTPYDKSRLPASRTRRSSAVRR